VQCSCVGQTSLSILAKGLKASVRNMVDHTGKESVITPDNYTYGTTSSQPTTS
jgi:hypothetical protein